MKGGGLRFTTAVVSSTTGSVEPGPVALTLSAESKVVVRQVGTQDDVNASGSWFAHLRFKVTYSPSRCGGICFATALPVILFKEPFLPSNVRQLDSSRYCQAKLE